ncbi:cupin domain-containing protein [Thalassospira sp. MA62]|nr:cupin domain-containing protein [Thalassospira sp. MA62]
MSDSTISIGTKLRHARKIKGMRLCDLADQVDCSEGFLSKLENDKVKPSLQLLHRIVAVLETSISTLFSETNDDIVSRAGTRQILHTSNIRPGEGVSLETLVSPTPGHLLFATIHIVGPGGGSSGPIVHEGEEVGYVLEGELDLNVDGTEYHLTPGDSFFFPSQKPHGYRNPTDKETRVLWVNTPPTF